jgi:hypothetical protein
LLTQHDMICLTSRCWLVERACEGNHIIFFPSGNAPFLTQVLSVPSATLGNEIPYPACAFASPSMQRFADGCVLRCPAFDTGEAWGQVEVVGAWRLKICTAIWLSCMPRPCTCLIAVGQDVSLGMCETAPARSCFAARCIGVRAFAIWSSLMLVIVYVNDEICSLVILSEAAHLDTAANAESELLQISCSIRCCMTSSNVLIGGPWSLQTPKRHASRVQGK